MAASKKFRTAKNFGFKSFFFESDLEVKIMEFKTNVCRGLASQ